MAVFSHHLLPARRLLRGRHFRPLALLYQSDFGLVNEVLRFLGFRGVRWLSSVTWAMPAIIIMSIWHGLGYNIVIFIAGLQGIPQDYYEAATVDGANAWQ